MGSVWVWLLAGPRKCNWPSVTFWSVFQNPVTFIKFTNCGTWCLNGPWCLFHFSATWHIFEPLRVYEPGFNTDKCGACRIHYFVCNLKVLVKVHQCCIVHSYIFGINIARSFYGRQLVMFFQTLHVSTLLWVFVCIITSKSSPTPHHLQSLNCTH